MTEYRYKTKSNNLSYNVQAFQFFTDRMKELVAGWSEDIPWWIYEAMGRSLNSQDTICYHTGSYYLREENRWTRIPEGDFIVLCEDDSLERWDPDAFIAQHERVEK